MRLEQFEYLLAAAQYGSMSAAGEKLHVTPQSISKAMKALEEELGAALLVRDKHGVALTADGEIVYRQAEIIMQAVGLLQQSYGVETLPGPDFGGTLNVLTSAALSQMLLELVKSLSARYPQLNISVIVNESLEINRLLTASGQETAVYDAVMTSTHADELALYRPLRENYDIYYLEKSRLGLQVSRRDKLAAASAIPIKSLAQLPIVIYAPSISAKTSQILQLIEAQGVKITPTFVSNMPQRCTEYVQNGQGYGLMSIPQKQSADAPTVIVPLQEKIYLLQLMLIPKNPAPTAQSKLLKQAILKHFAKTCKRL